MTINNQIKEDQFERWEERGIIIFWLKFLKIKISGIYRVNSKYEFKLYSTTLLSIGKWKI